MADTLVYRRGAPIVVDVVVLDNMGYDLTTLTLKMDLKVAVNKQPPPAATTSVASFNMTFNAAAGATPAYWRGTLNSVVPVGMYVTDVVIKSGSTVLDYTNYVLIQVKETVTTP